jgi:hypothetical protein
MLTAGTRGSWASRSIGEITSRGSRKIGGHACLGASSKGQAGWGKARHSPINSRVDWPACCWGRSRGLVGVERALCGGLVRSLHTSARLRSVPFSRRPAPCDGGDPAYTARGDAQGQVCRSGQGVARSAALGDLSSPAASRVEGRTRPAAPAFAADFPSRTQPRQPWRKWPLRRYASRHKCISARVGLPLCR